MAEREWGKVWQEFRSERSLRSRCWEIFQTPGKCWLLCFQTILISQSKLFYALMPEICLEMVLQPQNRVYFVFNRFLFYSYLFNPFYNVCVCVCVHDKTKKELYLIYSNFYSMVPPQFISISYISTIILKLYIFQKLNFLCI